ncbi:MAG: hypothetical protein WBZ29_04465 [Methanocella sp.]
MMEPTVKCAGCSRHVPIIVTSDEVEPVYREAFGVFLEALVRKIEKMIDR